MTHVEAQRALGSYVLGALSPLERGQVDDHLATCAGCRDELASYASLPGLLSRVDREEVLGATLLPPPSLLPALLAAVEGERSARGRQVSRWRLAAAALTTAAAVAGLAVIAGPSAGAEQRPMVAASGLSAAGTVSLQPRPWGTEFHLRLTRLPAAGGFSAYAVDQQGVRRLAATWGPTPTGRAEIPAATDLKAREVAGIVVETSNGRQVLALQA